MKATAKPLENIKKLANKGVLRNFTNFPGKYLKRDPIAGFFL